MQPPSRLAKYSGRLIEAGWLATLGLLPLAFDPLAGEVFEPVKSACLRWFACLMLAAMAVNAWERRPGPGLRDGVRGLLALPLAWPVLGVVATVLLASLFSLQPELSFLGSQSRAQGALTVLAGAVLFLALVLHLREGRQWRRLVGVVLLASVPVAIYALVQRAGLDPLTWSQPVQQRAASSLGNPIFLAAYLAMASLLTLGWLLEVPRLHGAYALLGALFALQVGGMLAAGSRGPVLAWAVALGLFALLLLLARHPGGPARGPGPAARGRRVGLWLWLPVLMVGAGAAAFGMARLVDLDQGSGRARVLIWEGAAQLLAPHAPLLLANGDPDPGHRLRPWLGHGPETFSLVFHRVFPPELAYLDSRWGMPDRAHSETFDALVMTGLLGFVAQQALFLGGFQLGLAVLGWLPGRRAAGLSLGAMLVGGAALVALAVAWRGSGLAAPAWPLGVAGGLATYVALAALARGRHGYLPGMAPWPGAFAAALLCTLLAHYLETGLSGIAVPATRSLAWACLGMLVVLRLHPAGAAQVSESRPPAPVLASRGGAVLAGVLLLGVAWAGHACLAPLRADRLASVAARHAIAGDWSAALAYQEQALVFRPRADRYHAGLASLWLRQAKSLPLPRRAEALARAEAALRRAADLAPLNPVHSIQLGRLHFYWAGQESTPSMQRKRLAAAAAAYGQAAQLSPHQAHVWNEWAGVQLQRHRVELAEGRPAAAAAELGLARRYLGQSLVLDGQYDRSFLVSAALAEADGNLAAAAAAYQRALYHNPSLVEAWQGLAALHRRDPGLARLEVTARRKLEAHPDLVAPWRILVTDVYLPAARLDEAIAAQRRVLALCPDAPVRSFEQLSLAVMLAEAGQGREALELARASLDGLPAERQVEARALIDLLAGW